jgi:uncharacterized secreted repeat protein (TIGR03808 family)
MRLDRRDLLSAFAAGSAVSVANAAVAAPRRGQDAANFILQPGAAEDHSLALQRALDESAKTRTPLVLPAGIYRASNLKLPAGAHVLCTRGATTLALSQGGASLISAVASDNITLSGLIFDGAHKPLPDRKALVHLENCQSVKIADCAFRTSTGSALVAVGSSGEFIESSFVDTAEVAIHVLDSRGMLIARNRIKAAGNGGIQVWRSQLGDDGTMVIDNAIEQIANRSGGSGQYGNAINVFRAAGVMVRGNRIRDCAFSAVRGNAASNLHIEGNSIRDAREVAIYAEFGFEGALIANNSIAGAAIGISVTNFNQGGRLAVVQGNIIRDLLPKRPAGTAAGDGAGIGIAVEADTTVNGNIIENAPTAGIICGLGDLSARCRGDRKCRAQNRDRHRGVGSCPARARRSSPTI